MHVLSYCSHCDTALQRSVFRSAERGAQFFDGATVEPIAVREGLGMLITGPGV